MLAMQLLCIPLFAQVVLDHQVISSAGNYMDGGLIKASQTTGEAVVGTFVTSNLIITQGFEQPLPTDIPVGIKNTQPEGTKISIYPNPTMDKVTLEFFLTTSIRIVIDTYNETGQLVYQSDVLNIQNNSKQELEFSGFPAGSYFVQIRSTDSKLNQVYKVEKKK
jgi:hypothetical protein